MKPLELNYQAFVLLCICPPNAGSSIWIKLKKIAYSVLTVLTLSTAIISTTAFIVKNFATNLERTLIAGYQFGSLFYFLYTLLVSYTVRHEIKQIFDDFKAFFDKNSGQSKLLIEADQRGEKMFIFFRKYFSIGCPLCMIFLAITSIVAVLLKNGYISSSEAFYRPFVFVLPWDQRSVLGWIYEITFSVIMSYLALCTGPPFVTFFIWICEYHRAFIEMFKERLGTLEKVAQYEPLRLKDIQTDLVETINHHVSVKSIFERTAKVYSVFILIIFIGSTISVSSNVLALDLSLRNGINENTFIISFSTVFNGVSIYLYCHHGKCATDYYKSYADCLYESNWIILPNHLRKSFVLMIAHGQKEIFYDGYGLIKLDLERFTRLLKTIITYYLMFKTLITET